MLQQRITDRHPCSSASSRFPLPGCRSSATCRSWASCPTRRGGSSRRRGGWPAGTGCCRWLARAVAAGWVPQALRQGLPWHLGVSCPAYPPRTEAAECMLLTHSLPACMHACSDAAFDALAASSGDEAGGAHQRLPRSDGGSGSDSESDGGASGFGSARSELEEGSDGGGSDSGTACTAVLYCWDVPQAFNVAAPSYPCISLMIRLAAAACMKQIPPAAPFPARRWRQQQRRRRQGRSRRGRRRRHSRPRSGQGSAAAGGSGGPSEQCGAAQGAAAACQVGWIRGLHQATWPAAARLAVPLSVRSLMLHVQHTWQQ